MVWEQQGYPQIVARALEHWGNEKQVDQLGKKGQMHIMGSYSTFSLAKDYYKQEFRQKNWVPTIQTLEHREAIDIFGGGGSIGRG